MGAIEDARRVLQDFLAPEPRAISVRLGALEKRFDESEHRFDKRLDESEHRFDKRLDDAERRAEKRHDEVMTAIRQVIDLTSIQQRPARLESKEAPHL